MYAAPRRPRRARSTRRTRSGRPPITGVRRRPLLLPAGARRAARARRRGDRRSALVTAGSRAIVEPQIERLGPRRTCCRSACSATTSPPRSPIPAPLLRALRELGAAGDRRADVPTWATRRTTCGWRSRPASARSASCLAVQRPRRQLRDAGAAEVVDRSRRGPTVPRRPRDRRCRARPPPTGLTGACTPSSSPTAIRRDLAALDATWPGWRDGIELDRRRRRRRATARDARAARIDLVVGDGDSLGDDGLAELAAAGIRVERSPADKDESDTELAVLACLARGATSITIVGGLRRPRSTTTLANIWLLALPALEDRPMPSCSTAGRASDSFARPGRDGAARRRSAPGPRRRPRDAAAARRATSKGITTEGLRYPLRDEPLRLGPARGLSNVRVTVDGRRHRPPRTAPGRGIAYVWRHDESDDARRNPARAIPTVGDAGPGRRPARRDRHGPPPRRPARPLDDPLLLSRGRHVGLHHGGVPVPRPPRGHRRERRRRVGREPGRRRQSTSASRRSTACRSRSCPTRTTTVIDAVRRVGRQGQLRQEVHGPHPLVVPDRPRRPDREGLAEGQGRRPRGQGLEALTEAQSKRAGPDGAARPAMTDGARRGAPRVAARAVHGHRRAPRRRRLRARGDGRPLDRRRIRRAGSSAARAATRAARTPTSTRMQLALTREAEQRRGRGRSSAMRASRSSTSPTARSPTTCRCASCWSARSGRSGRTPCSPTIPDVVATRRGGINHTDHRAAGIAAVDAVYPAARNPMAFPHLARTGLALQRVRRIYLFWPNEPDTWIDMSATLDRKVARCAQHASQLKRPEDLEDRDPAIGGRDRARRSGRRGRGLPAGRHRRGRGGRAQRTSRLAAASAGSLRNSHACSSPSSALPGRPFCRASTLRCRFRVHLIPFWRSFGVP